MKSFYMQNSLGIFLTLIILISTTDVEHKNLNTVKDISKLSIKEVKNILIKQEEIEAKYRELNKDGPKLPKEMPKDLKMMQDILMKSYGLAYEKVFPRFSEATNTNSIGTSVKSTAKSTEKSTAKSSGKSTTTLKDPHGRVNWELSREKWWDERTVEIKDAWANSVFIWKWWWWSFPYPALNAARSSGYWSSTGSHKKTDVIIWEATFFRLTFIHGLGLIWAYSPGEFAIQYSQDGNKFDFLVNWRESIDDKKPDWWNKLFPHFKLRLISFPDRFTFDKPVWAIKMRILMRNPVHHFFGLYKVDFWMRDWVAVLKNTQKDQCDESCWTVNTNYPTEGSHVEYAKCNRQIFITENRELFVLDPEGVFYHYETGLCVVTSQDKELKLEDCSSAVYSNDGRAFYTVNPDGSIQSEYDSQECITVPKNPKTINLALNARTEVNSVSGTGANEGMKAVDGNKNTFWSTHPGEKWAVITIYFNEWVTANDLKIIWKYPAKNFDIFAYTVEKRWKHMFKVTGNKKKESNFRLKSYNISALQIKMTKSVETYMKLPIYGITEIELLDGGMRLTRDNCKNSNKLLKKWFIDLQFFFVISAKVPYTQAWNKLTQTYLKLRSLSREIHLDWKMIETANKKALHLKQEMNDLEVQLKAILKKLKSYMSMDLPSIMNPKFIDIIVKHLFHNYFEKSKNGEINEMNQVGATSKSAVSDCHKIKAINPLKKSGFYWIKPRCAPKPLRVFCDFSSYGKGVSFIIFNNDQEPNTDLDTLEIETYQDIRYICAKQGYYPIDIINKDMMTTLVYLLKSRGWDISRSMTIPLGYDYECDDGACSEDFYSFVSDEGEGIQDHFLETPSYLEKLWAENKNTIGLGYDRNGKPTFFNLKETKITALICSTNKYGIEENPDYVSLSCSDTILTKEGINQGPGTSSKIKCPSLCGSQDSTPVFGSGKYSQSSSICRAAIHSGKLKNLEGGVVMLKVGAKESNLKGGTKNGITSLNFPSESLVTISFEENHDKCPLDFNKNPKKDDEKNGKKGDEEEDDDEFIRGLATSGANPMVVEFEKLIQANIHAPPPPPSTPKAYLV